MNPFAVDPSKSNEWGTGTILPVGRHLVIVDSCTGKYSTKGNPIWEIVCSNKLGTIQDRAPLAKVATLLKSLGFEEGTQVMPEHITGQGYQVVVDVQEQPGLSDPTRLFRVVQAFLPYDTPIEAPPPVQKPHPAPEPKAPQAPSAPPVPPAPKPKQAEQKVKEQGGEVQSVAGFPPVPKPRQAKS